MDDILQALHGRAKVGTAFSGGLDTAAALHSMRANRAIAYTYTDHLGQARGAGLRRHPEESARLRRRESAADHINELARMGALTGRGLRALAGVGGYFEAVVAGYKLFRHAMVE